MKKILLLLFCVPLIAFGQTTYIPDDSLEYELILLGYDNVMDDYVNTASIDTVTILDISNVGVHDMTGIEDFISLEELYCYQNNYPILNLNNNTQLKKVDILTNFGIDSIFIDN